MSVARVVVSYRARPAHRAALVAAAPGAEVAFVESVERAREAIVDADAYLGNPHFLQALPAARRLRWMQSGSVGIDQILAGVDWTPTFTLTRVGDCYDDEVAEHAVALLLAASRRLCELHDRRRAGTLAPVELPLLAGGSAVVLGLGGIGRGIVRRLIGLGMQVAGVRASHTGPPETMTGGGVVHGPHTWQDLLPGARALVVALPLTHATRHLVGRAELAQLQPGAVVVNVGRGGTVDDDALDRELRAGRLLAGLDVYESEPFAPGHRLWDAPGLVATPHVGRAVEPGPRRFEPLFVENLRRFCAGRPLLHVVDPQRGY